MNISLETTDEQLIWTEWGRITRFLESSLIAFNREDLLLSSLEIKDSQDITLSTEEGKSTYKISLEHHLHALHSHDVLFSTVLHSTYALAEAFARLKLEMTDEEELTGGIESWGKSILAKMGHTWQDVGTVVPYIELSAVRNAYAHGLRNVNQKMVNRFTDHGHICPWTLGEKIDLDYAGLEKYQSHLKTLMRLSSKPRRGPTPTSEPQGKPSNGSPSKK
jgi:hypothetical protein